MVDSIHHASVLKLQFAGETQISTLLRDCLLIVNNQKQHVSGIIHIETFPISKISLYSLLGMTVTVVYHIEQRSQICEYNMMNSRQVTIRFNVGYSTSLEYKVVRHIPWPIEGCQFSNLI